MMAIVIALAVVVATIILLLPGVIAFKRHHKYRWVILILGIIPLYWVGWFVALIWAVWPTE